MMKILLNQNKELINNKKNNYRSFSILRLFSHARVQSQTLNNKWEIIVKKKNSTM